MAIQRGITDLTPEEQEQYKKLTDQSKKDRILDSVDKMSSSLSGSMSRETTSFSALSVAKSMEVESQNVKNLNVMGGVLRNAEANLPETEDISTEEREYREATLAALNRIDNSMSFSNKQNVFGALIDSVHWKLIGAPLEKLGNFFGIRRAITQEEFHDRALVAFRSLPGRFRNYS